VIKLLLFLKEKRKEKSTNFMVFLEIACNTDTQKYVDEINN